MPAVAAILPFHIYYFIFITPLRHYYWLLAHYIIDYFHYFHYYGYWLITIFTPFHWPHCHILHYFHYFHFHFSFRCLIHYYFDIMPCQLSWCFHYWYFAISLPLFLSLLFFIVIDMTPFILILFILIFHYYSCHLFQLLFRHFH
jgi:hypothetical protein